MINLLKKLLGIGAKADFAELARKGATILDVRTQSEFQNEHITGSMNIPIQELQGNLSKLDKDKPVIICCASGVRSAAAKNILKTDGFSEVYNGGGWASLQRKL